MQIRTAPKTLTRLALLALFLTGAILFERPAGAQHNIELTLDQTRVLAVDALNRGDPGLTVQLGRGLLLADPRDPVAHYLIAMGHAGLNQPRSGRVAAARAYRLADPGSDRFRAAELAARLALAEGRPTLSQIWLRRTAVHAPTEADKQAIARDYRAMRRINPWSLRLRGDLRPSSNVNNGSDTALQIIDGVPVTGVLSGAAQALSGLIGSLDMAVGYRLRGDERSVTSIGGRLYQQRVALSGSAKALAPTTRNSDFSSTFVEMSLRHGFAVGAPEKNGSAAVDIALGESWWSGARSYRFARLGAERNWQLSGRTGLQISAQVEQRFESLYAVNEAQILGLGAEIAHKLDNGDRLGLGLALRDSSADSANGTYRSGSLRASYALGQAIGGVHISGGLVFGYSDYPIFRSGILDVPGGRQDTSVHGDVSLFFDRLDYAGFAPMLRIRTGRKSSNDSRFETRDTSVSLGIESKF